MEDCFITPVIIKVESLANIKEDDDLVSDPLSIEGYPESCIGNFTNTVSKQPKLSRRNVHSPTKKSEADSSYILEPKIELFVYENKISPIPNPCVGFSKHPSANCNSNPNANIIVKHEPINTDLNDDDDGEAGTERNTNQKRKFVCQLCAKVFHKGTRLKRHMETHKSAQDRERRFKCPVCAVSFVYNSHLNDHIKRHENDLPFKCAEPNCKRAFNIKSDLTSHYTSHTNLKPFKCPHSHCSKTFKYKRSTKAHVQQFHTTTKRQFKCTEDTDNCSRAYVTSNQLQVHQRSAHKKPPKNKNR